MKFIKVTPIGEEKMKKMLNLLKNNDLCPICELGKLKEKVEDDIINICGNMIKVKDMKSFICNICNDGFYDNETSIKLDNLVIKYRKKL